MKREAGMTLIEVMVALVIFALAGLAVMQSTLQQTRQLGRMEEKILASWLADNQLVQLRLEKRWPALSWSETTVEAAGTRWFVRWQGVETALPQLRALDVEVRRQKSDPAPLATLRPSQAALLVALFPGDLTLQEAQQLLHNRPRTGWSSVAAFLAQPTLQKTDTTLARPWLTVHSARFIAAFTVVTGNLRFQLHSVLQQEGRTFTVVQRRYGLSMVVDEQD